MMARLSVPTFPFPADDVCWAVDFRNTVLGLSDVYGGNPDDWSDVTADIAFQEAVVTHWVFLHGREPAPGVALNSLLREVLAVTEEQFVARTQTGATPS